jgi:hypothetical protein
MCRSQSRADRRAEHNALERARRESLNSKFQKLALSLPNLSSDSRPSKNTIIERTLDFVQEAQLKEERMRNQIEELERVNRYLLSQLDNKDATSQNVTRRSSCISLNSSSMNHSPHIPKYDEMENRTPIKLETSPSPPSSVPPTITPLPHDKNKSDATAYHAYNQAFMQNLHHTQYDESEDDEDITELNQINPFAFHHQQQSYPIMPQQLQCKFCVIITLFLLSSNLCMCRFFNGLFILKYAFIYNRESYDTQFPFLFLFFCKYRLLI